MKLENVVVSGCVSSNPNKTEVRVAFDLTCSLIVLSELEKNIKVKFISKELRITDLHLNNDVDPRVVDVIKSLEKQYNDICDLTPLDERDAKDLEERKHNAYIRLLYSIPIGVELKSRIDISLKDLREIYLSKCNSDIIEWQEFCNEIGKILDDNNYED